LKIPIVFSKETLQENNFFETFGISKKHIFGVEVAQVLQVYTQMDRISGGEK
jgi:hypothetical protein